LEINLQKSTLHVDSMEFLVYGITLDGIRITERKIEEVKNWPVPRKVKDIQEFLSFENFYRRFIKGFSNVAYQLTELMRKGQNWNWTSKCREAFEELKTRFSTAFILSHFQSKHETIVETNASDYAIGAVLSQRTTDSKVYPCAFLARKFAEMNYDIYDKEMAAIVQAFKEWEPLLKGCRWQITVWTDYKNLKYFRTTKTLTRRQARWAEFIAEFDFVVKYGSGDKNRKPDALSRCWDHRPKEGSEDLQPIQLLFKPGQLQISAIRVVQLKDSFQKQL